MRYIFSLCLLFGLMTGTSIAAEIVRDAEYYILEAQNGEAWAVDDESVDNKLAAFRKNNSGKPPNIVYILIDDIGFGDLGIPELNAIRGYKTPNINKFAREAFRAYVHRTLLHAYPCCLHDRSTATP